LYFLLQPPAGALSPTEVLTPAPRVLAAGGFWTGRPCRSN